MTLVHHAIRDSRIAYVTVEHENYGCESGCCGWTAYAFDESGDLLHESSFEFVHAWVDDVWTAAQDFAWHFFPGVTLNKAESDPACPDDDE